GTPKLTVTPTATPTVTPAAFVLPAGAEFQVNTYTTGDQERADVCRDASGNFVVVWESGRQRGHQDGSASGIFAQRFDAAGGRLGTEFQVNTYTTSYQLAPRVACASAGAFVVAWSSTEYPANQIRAQRYNSAGATLGAEFEANTYVTGNHQDPAIAS